LGWVRTPIRRTGVAGNVEGIEGMGAPLRQPGYQVSLKAGRQSTTHRSFGITHYDAERVIWADKAKRPPRHPNVSAISLISKIPEDDYSNAAHPSKVSTARNSSMGVWRAVFATLAKDRGGVAKYTGP